MIEATWGHPALVEAVEMVAIGGTCSLLSAILVLAVGDAVHAIDASALGKDANAYLFDRPTRLLGSVTVFLLLNYVGAGGAAYLIHREAEAVFKPGRHVWQQVFWWGRDSATDATMVLVELRDGRKMRGELGTFTRDIETTEKLH